MANSCVWMPNKGQKTFAQLRSNFDYSIAAEVFNKVRGSEFKEMFKSSLKLDEEGIPTYNSILNNPIIQDYIGMTQVIESFQKKQPVLPDVSENIELLINKATEFCKENPSLTAYVDYTKEGNLTLKIADITSGDAEILYNQKRILALNSTIARILAPAGITIGTLNELEVAAGRVGETNFIHAKDIADNFAGLLRVANNMEGTVAVSEEFAHLLVRINKNTSLIKRGLEFLKSHLSQTIDILGDQYSNVFRYYDGDMAKVAEEALGQMLQNALLEANNKKDAITKKVPLFKRILDFILKPFKGINPGNYQTAIDHLQDDLTKLASDYINGKKTITQEDIQATYDVSSFNALSEREQVQMDILKKSVENQYKLGALTQNLEERDGEFTEKYKIRKGADNLESQISSLAKEEETVAATAVFLDNAIDNLQDLFNQLDILETKGLQDRFIVLRNSLYTIQAYSETLKELGNTFTEEFFKDPKLSSQKFLTENISNDLAAAETSNIEEEAVDTSNMSIDEIIDLINMEANNWIVDKNDPKFYINKKTGEKALRVTKTIEGDKNATVFDPNSPWVIPSTNIGTGIDELVRDFFTGRITYDGNSWTVNGENLASIYPNASSEQLNKFCAQLQGLKNKFKEDGITIVPRNIVAQGITQTIDGTGKIHNIKTVGTLDLIV